MDLHRAGSQPEWLAVKPARYNYWQRLAAKTNGIITPGNIITIAGLLIALGGLIAVIGKHYWLSLGGLLIGRLFDLADGWAAARTGTKSPLGELLDATVDKIVTFAALLLLGTSHLVPWLALILLAFPHIIITIIASRAFLIGQRFHPSRLGKISMAIAWVAIVGLLLSYAIDVQTLRVISYVIGGLSFGLGLLALSGYIKTIARSASA